MRDSFIHRFPRKTFVFVQKQPITAAHENKIDRIFIDVKRGRGKDGNRRTRRIMAYTAEQTFPVLCDSIFY